MLRVLSTHTTHWKPLFVFSLLIVATITSSISGVAYASGGKGARSSHSSGTTAQSINASCTVSPPITDQNALLTIAYVNKSYSVYVRSSPTTSACAITTQGPTMDVVLVSRNPGGWDQVLYYFNLGCRSCSHYDWNHTGYMADFLLTVGSVGYTCYQSNCPTFSMAPGHTDIPPTNNCSSLPSDVGICQPNGNNTTLPGYTNVTPRATSADPNWWYEGDSCGMIIGCNYLWNDDWWAH